MNPSGPITRDRIVTFDECPTEQELGTVLGDCGIGSSAVVCEENDDAVIVRPEQVPIGPVTAWMYLVWLMGLFFLAWGEADLLIWLVWIFAAVFVIPAFLGILHLSDTEIGDLPYMVYCKATRTIRLPRLSCEWPIGEVRRVVFIDRYVANSRLCFQIALLVEDDTQWLYAHVYNDAGRHLPIGPKPPYRVFAERLGIEVQCLRFRKNHRWE